MSEAAAHVRVMEETPAYWRVVFDYPPFNIVDASIFGALQDLLARMDASPSLRVVVFERANPDFYLAHFDLTGKIGNIMTAVGASGLPILMAESATGKVTTIPSLPIFPDQSSPIRRLQMNGSRCMNMNKS